MTKTADSFGKSGREGKIKNLSQGFANFLRENVHLAATIFRANTDFYPVYNSLEGEVYWDNHEIQCLFIKCTSI